MAIPAAVIDLETLGVESNKVIASIGIVYGDVELGSITHTFYVELDMQQQMQGHYNPDASTLAFWLEQNESARGQLAAMLKRGGVPRGNAFNSVCQYLRNLPENTRIFGNGPLFDLQPIAEFSTQAALPWKHWNERNVRDWIDICQLVTGQDVRKLVPFKGVKHNALDDAAHEFMMLHTTLKLLKGQQL